MSVPEIAVLGGILCRLQRLHITSNGPPSVASISPNTCKCVEDVVCERGPELAGVFGRELAQIQDLEIGVEGSLHSPWLTGRNHHGRSSHT